MAASAISDSAVSPAVAGAIQFARELLERREANLAPDIGLSSAQTLAMNRCITGLEYAIRELEQHGFDARSAIENRIALLGDDNGGLELRRVLEKLGTPPAPAGELGRSTTIERHQTTIVDLVRLLARGQENSDERTLLVFDYDETLVTSIQNAMEQLMAMADLSPSVEERLRSLVDTAIHDSELTCVDGDKVVPQTLEVLSVLNSLPNVDVVIITKRNAEGVEEVSTLLEPIIPGVRIIHTIRSNGKTIEKSEIICKLIRRTGAKLVHYAEDSEPHIRAVIDKFENTAGLEIHLHMVDLKAQIIGPALQSLMSLYG